MLATRPQFHWTDQKLHVHAFLCVTGYLLVRLLWWRARRDAGFTGSARRRKLPKEATERRLTSQSDTLILAGTTP
jgi:hypothetical protein